MKREIEKIVFEEGYLVVFFYLFGLAATHIVNRGAKSFQSKRERDIHPPINSIYLSTSSALVCLQTSHGHGNQRGLNLQSVAKE